MYLRRLEKEALVLLLKNPDKKDLRNLTAKIILELIQKSRDDLNGKKNPMGT